MGTSNTRQGEGAAFCVQSAAGTDVGRERENNEDALLFDSERGLFIICDGMGGMAAGDRASREAISSLERSLSVEALQSACEAGEEAARALLEGAFLAANDTIVECARQHFVCRNMGTTVVAAVLHGNKLTIAGYGDSRAYLFRINSESILESILLTEDQSTAAELVRNGTFTPEEARHHILRNRLTAALGHLEVGATPSFNFVELSPGDHVVLCSDGLWDLLEDTDIALIVRNAETPDEAVHCLITAANEAGGHDNITAIMLRAEGDPGPHLPTPPARIMRDPYKTVAKCGPATVRRYPD